MARLEAYAAGVNAYLATRRGPLPPEFLILGYEPEPWTPVNSLVWMRVLALDLGGNWRDELLRARLARRLSAEQIADLWPESLPSAPVTLARWRAPAGRCACRCAAAGAAARPGLERLGPGWQPHRERRAAARERPASGLERARALVPGAPRITRGAS